jgi:hypothetical protein
MAKQSLSRRRIGQFAALVFSLALVGCGSTSTALDSAPAVSASAVAPTEGSPEQTALELRRATFDGVAPIEGSPEATAFEIRGSRD